ncbi:acylase [Acidobacteria bacterium Mor1]|nr:acylase [Acidobacteria bacterium Mor1]
MAACCLFLALPTFAQQPTWRDEDRAKWLERNATVEKKLMVPMRDGVGLSTDLYLPKDHEGPLPTIFWRTPYNYNEMKGARLRFAHEAVSQGYAFVIQNERGRFFSGGEWEILGFPRTDGYDALTWIADQEWSNGKVGTIGCSSSAEWQMALAAMDHPAHASAVPMAPGAGLGKVGEFVEQGNWYRGGAEQMFYLTWLYWVQNTQRPRLPKGLDREDVVRLSKYFDLAPEMPEVEWKKKIWTLPLSKAMEEVSGPKGMFADFLSRGPEDPAWYESEGLWHEKDDFGVPALWMFSWYDISTGPNVAMVEHIRKNASDPLVREHQYMVMAPLLHCAFYRADYPLELGERTIENAEYAYEEQVFEWFDFTLKGEDNGFEKTPKNAYFTFGSDQWNTSDSWPPAGAGKKALYLSSSDGANSLFGDGKLSDKPAKTANVDRFTYDPLVPAPSVGGGVCCIGGTIDGGPFDQRSVEARADVLVYTSEPLKEDLEATGPVEVVLYVSSDAPDTDFTAKLIDVQPDGTAYNLDETIFRARYREGYDKQVMMEAGQVYELRMSSMLTSNVFKKGHRIRIDISSSNFPRFSRNMNTGGPNYNESEPKVAKNAVHLSEEHPSRIVLTVVEP